MARKFKFFQGDDVTLKFVFKIDGTQQIPSACTIKIVEDDGTETVAEGTVANVDGQGVCSFFVSDAQKGFFTAYFTGTLGTDKRTDDMKYQVILKDGVTT